MLVESLQPLLAPVVMILSLNARVMTAKARIRQFHLERLTIFERAGEIGHSTPTQRLRFESIVDQSNNLLSRLRLMRAALMCMVGCVSLMLVCSLLIGLSSVYPGIGYAAIPSFVAGLVSMLAGSLIFLFELRMALREIEHEHERVMGLTLPEQDGPSI